MIPKIIHYCWFGGNPLTDEVKQYIESWRKFCPDYDIIEWNENNFNVFINAYCREAYEAKKWAFVADYARFWILYKYGGVYFDTDVELIKPLDKIIKDGPFMGMEIDYEKARILNDGSIRVAPGLGLAANPGLGLYKDILDMYNKEHFLDSYGHYNGKTVVTYITPLLKARGLQNKPGIQKVADVLIYPCEYFCPKDFYTGMLNITSKTVTIHHYSASWCSKAEKRLANLNQHFRGRGKCIYTLGRLITLPFRLYVLIERKGIMGALRYVISRI